jgi:hypothetical protein
MRFLLGITLILLVLVLLYQGCQVTLIQVYEVHPSNIQQDDPMCAKDDPACYPNSVVPETSI